MAKLIMKKRKVLPKAKAGAVTKPNPFLKKKGLAGALAASKLTTVA